jgi:hypothetical protein
MHLVKRWNSMQPILLALCWATCGIAAFGAPRHSSAQHHKIDIFTGRVVAYSGGEACLNGSGYWSIVLHVEPLPDHPEPFLRVDFSLPCGKSPKWALAAPPAEKFRLHRQVDCKVALTGSMATDEKPKGPVAMPIWKMPPGSEAIALPFGQILPSYLSEDLPLKPVL